jgi:hypothetical protein
MRIPGSGIPNRLAAALERGKITTRGDLFRTAGAQLVDVAGVGPVAFAELWDYARGYVLAALNDGPEERDREPIAPPDPPADELTP